MTKPNEITVSLETAKQLEKAGYPQDGSNFYWEVLDSVDYPPREMLIFRNSEFTTMGLIDSGKEYDAPTAEEVLRKLPPMIRVICNDGSVEYRYLRITTEQEPLGKILYSVGYVPTNWSSPMPIPEWCSSDYSLADAVSGAYFILSNNNLL